MHDPDNYNVYQQLQSHHLPRVSLCTLLWPFSENKPPMLAFRWLKSYIVLMRKQGTQLRKKPSLSRILSYSLILMKSYHIVISCFFFVYLLLDRNNIFLPCQECLEIKASCLIWVYFCFIQNDSLLTIIANRPFYSCVLGCLAFE